MTRGNGIATNGHASSPPPPLEVLTPPEPDKGRPRRQTGPLETFVFTWQRDVNGTRYSDVVRTVEARDEDDARERLSGKMPAAVLANCLVVKKGSGEK